MLKRVKSGASNTTTMTYAIRFSHTARSCSAAIVSSLGEDKFCKGGGGRISRNGRREGTATAPEGLEAISDEGLDRATPEGAVALTEAAELYFKSWSEGRSRKFVCDIESSGGGQVAGTV